MFLLFGELVGWQVFVFVFSRRQLGAIAHVVCFCFRLLALAGGGWWVGGRWQVGVVVW